LKLLDISSVFGQDDETRIESTRDSTFDIESNNTKQLLILSGLFTVRWTMASIARFSVFPSSRGKTEQ